MRRPAFTFFLAGMLLLGGALSPRATGEEEDPLAEPIRVLLYAHDVGSHRIWDGIKKGLEFANTVKAGTEDLGKGPEGVLKRLEAKKPPLLLAIGAPAAAVLGGRLADVPRVYVYTAWNVNGEEFPPPIRPRRPARVLRQVTYAVKVAEVLRALWPPPTRPKGLLSWTPKTQAQRKHADALAIAAGFVRTESVAEADLILHLRLGVGEEPAAIEELVRAAKTHRIPLISDDPAHWRDKASILVIPNYNLLGRIAAEQGRLLLEEKWAREAEPLIPPAGMTEIWVDLRAARAQGLEAPVPWLAGVDRLRPEPRRPR